MDTAPETEPPIRSLSDKHRAELRASGISDDIISRAGLYTESGEAVAKLIGSRDLAGGSWADVLVFPFRFPTQNGNAAYARIKPDFPRIDRKGKTVKYESPSGQTNRAYFPPGFQDLIATRNEVIITEGEKKALSAATAGFPCVGLVGVRGWHLPRKRIRGTPNAAGELILIPDLAGLSWSGRTVYICFDSDAANNRNVQSAEWALATSLKRLKADVRVVRLPSLSRSVKVGLDDYLVAQGPIELAKLLAAAKPPEKPVKSQPYEFALEALDCFYRHADGYTLHWYRGQFWSWNGRYYIPYEMEEVSRRFHRWLYRTFGPVEANPTFARQVSDCAASETMIASTTAMPCYVEKSGQIANRNWINLTNGNFDLDVLIRGEDKPILLPQSPRWFTPVGLPYGFTAEAVCPLWDQFLLRIMEGDQERISFLQEWLGYNLVLDTSLDRFVIFEGPGGNGKGVFLDVMTEILGRDNVSHVPLEQFGDRFQLTPTIGKLANIVQEISDVAKPNEGTLKAFVSSTGRIGIDRKNKDPISIKPTARLTLACNKRPHWSDRTDGIWRRLTIIPFRISLTQAEMDRGLTDKIINSELPGVFLWALAGLLRLKQRGDFVTPQVARATAEE